MPIFPIGIGIDLSDTYVHVAKVSYFGRIIEVQEREIPSGWVVDEKVVESEKLKFFLQKNCFSQEQILRSRVAILIPESRMFRCSLRLPKDKKKPLRSAVVDLAQREIPFPLSSADVLMNFSQQKNEMFADVEAVEGEVIKNLVAAVPQEHNHLKVVEPRSRALLDMANMRGLLPSGFVGFVDANERWVTITIFNKGQVVYSRAIRQPISFDQNQKKVPSVFVDFLNDLLDEIVLYYQEDHKMIDRFILSGLFFTDQRFRGPFKTSHGEVRIEFIDDLFSLKEKKIPHLFFGMAAIGAAFSATRFTTFSRPCNFFRL
ncbi:pilus assembly protein PilM [Candidatus Uhrbacteria bacterium]|nr:pilus assembly protein PilM [Candidatus Uhrbacteria bacterium]